MGWVAEEIERAKMEAKYDELQEQVESEVNEMSSDEVFEYLDQDALNQVLELAYELAAEKKLREMNN